jgi:hypothetical protein
MSIVEILYNILVGQTKWKRSRGISWYKQEIAIKANLQKYKLWHGVALERIQLPTGVNKSDEISDSIKGEQFMEIYHHLLSKTLFRVGFYMCLYTYFEGTR